MFRFDTAIGPCGVAWNEAGITAVALLDPGPTTSPDPPPHILEAVARMTALLEGEPEDLTAIVLDESGLDEIRRAVYHATRAIPPGQTKGYGEIAKEIGVQ